MTLQKLQRTGVRVLACMAVSGATAAWAHNPIAECKAVDGQMIECQGGFSDGSGAPGITLEVVGYDEKVLLSGKLGSDSKLRFKRPADDFYILLDAGPGHVIEIDQTEIDEIYSNTIAPELGRLDPDNAPTYRDNASAYGQKLRADALAPLAQAPGGGLRRG